MICICSIRKHLSGRTFFAFLSTETDSSGSNIGQWKWWCSSKYPCSALISCRNRTFHCCICMPSNIQFVQNQDSTILRYPTCEKLWMGRVFTLSGKYRNSRRINRTANLSTNMSWKTVNRKKLLQSNLSTRTSDRDASWISYFATWKIPMMRAKDKQ